MGYQEALHAAHKARLRRMGAAAANRPNSKRQPSEDGAPAVSNVQLIADLRAEIARLQAERAARCPHSPAIEAIKAVVAEAYGIATVDIENGRREIKYLFPRMIAIHLACRHTASTLAEIAGRFGRRGHAPARYANRRILDRRESDPAFDAELCELERRLRTCR
jgi:chromosomal replication initiation ATPase DnaA